ncbi:MAG TPA: hypothetical protein VM287_14415, partial [Egibacteraceae bacterium]|nr:hypothetical protein [Egibacteraceae bacterium]
LQGYGVHDLDLLLQFLPPVEAVAAATEVGVPVRTSGGDELLAVTAEDARGPPGRTRRGDGGSP